MKLVPTVLRLASGGLLAVLPLAQSPGEVLAEAKLTEGLLGFVGPLAPGDAFGEAVCVVGDIDGDGVDDLAVGAPGDDLRGPDHGAVWILFLDALGTVREEVRIDEVSAGLPGPFQDGAFFGGSLAAVGDLDGNGVPDRAVGGPGVQGPSLPAFPDEPRYWVLLLERDATVVGTGTVTYTELTGTTLGPDDFARGMAAADLDGDGRNELVVGAPRGGPGDVFTVRQDASGNRVSSTITSVPPSYPIYNLGHAVANIGDRNGDGIPDVLVSNPLNFVQVGGPPPLSGGLVLLFLDAVGNATSRLEIATGKGGLSLRLNADDKFGLAIAHLADLDGNGATEVAVGANDDGSFAPLQAPGLVWVLFLEPDGTVGSELLLRAGSGGFTGPLAAFDRFGEALAWWPFRGPGGAGTLWVGAPGDDLVGTDAGAVWRLALDGVDDPPAVVVRNGTHVNPVVLHSTSLPIVDSTWSAVVDASSFPTTTTTWLVGYAEPARIPLGLGELLVLIEPLGTNLFVDTAAVVAGLGQHVLPIPDDLSFVGREIHVQGLLAGGGPRLTNALELTIGGP